MRFSLRRVLGLALLVVAGVITVGACGSSEGGGGGSGQAGGGPPVGDPDTGNWLDLGNTHAPPHEPAVPTNTGVVTRGGTLTFTNIGAEGYWGRRIEAEPGDPRCDVQSETLDFGWGSEFCCRTKHEVTSNLLTPFNEQLTMVLDGPLRVKQFAVYQPLGDRGGPWAIRSFWDRRTPDTPYNFHFSGPNDASIFDGDLGNSCTFFAMQQRKFPCGPGSDPYCPGSALDYDGWPGSKLVVLLASMPYADDPSLKPLSCIAADQDEREQDSPWIGISPSELNRDGWSGYHPCHCFNNTNSGQLGDGCGQINVFEVIAEASGPQWGNRDVISTGIRSYQVGSLGGVTCGIQSCGIEQFPADADLLDVNSLTAMNAGAVIDADHPATKEGPAWRRAQDDRYYLFLLDELSRTVQVAVIHPGKIPEAAQAIVPALPNTVLRTAIDGFASLRLPQ
ncbi:DUF2403 domain-containing lipoprotein [Polyangium sp. 6x1]|uniref:DUF2403 domain-containing lipoprotein n=1 Tax=Polyangium sp. 6x1 TaxID=3042689 RepID=UPI00248220B9|nr:DUF2403 domain-containing lipoprotein [Polyangium sp. 6x1]MDI1442512.1 DUF2403 domain-containing lipoprotein [Polyangium sp. 6x1]